MPWRLGSRPVDNTECGSRICLSAQARQWSGWGSQPGSAGPARALARHRQCKTCRHTWGGGSPRLRMQTCAATQRITRNWAGTMSSHSGTSWPMRRRARHERVGCPALLKGQGRDEPVQSLVTSPRSRRGELLTSIITALSLSGALWWRAPFQWTPQPGQSLRKRQMASLR